MIARSGRAGLAVVLAAVVAVTVACGALGIGGGSPAGPAPPSDPLSLVGWWQIDGSTETVAVDPSALRIRNACGWIDAAWQGDPAGRFVSELSGAELLSGGSLPPTCTPADVAAYPPSWLATATAFVADGPDRVLVDRTGDEVLRLRPAPPGPDRTVDPSRPATPRERSAALVAAPVPGGMRAAAPAELTGRWRPAVPASALVEFDPDGVWFGSDGCNPVGGRWLGGPDGEFLAMSPPTSTLIACGSVPLGTWLRTARRVALDGADLVLFDVTGAPVGRFVRG